MIPNLGLLAETVGFRRLGDMALAAELELSRSFDQLEVNKVCTVSGLESDLDQVPGTVGGAPLGWRPRSCRLPRTPGFAFVPGPGLHLAAETLGGRLVTARPTPCRSSLVLETGYS